MARPVGGEQARVGTAPAGPRDRLAAGSVIGAHTLQHTYQHGFYVIVPELYTVLGLTPVAAGALEMVRRISGGVASLGGGFLLDRFQDKRVLVLYLSLVTMGLGYLLVGVVPVPLMPAAVPRACRTGPRGRNMMIATSTMPKIMSSSPRAAGETTGGPADCG